MFNAITVYTTNHDAFTPPASLVPRALLALHRRLQACQTPRAWRAPPATSPRNLAQQAVLDAQLAVLRLTRPTSPVLSPEPLFAATVKQGAP